MPSRLKDAAAGLLPARLHVPVHYVYGRLRGYHEPEMRLLPDLVRARDRAIDVGGNRGTYAYRLAQLGARVDVFEPNPAYLRGLAGWAARRRDVAVHRVALSSSEGRAALNIPVGAGGIEHGSAASIEAASAGRDSRAEMVALRTLDSYAISDAAFIKIDVEGHEHAVIAGAAETLRASCPALLVEIEQRHVERPIQDVFDEIAALGYRGFFLLDGRLRPLATFAADLHQASASHGSPPRPYVNNFLFLHAARIDGGRYRALQDRWL